VGASPLDPYFEAIDSGDVERTTAAFSEDALYVRPSLRVPGTLDVARGRYELRAFFQARGKKPFRHVVRTFAVDGAECYAEGSRSRTAPRSRRSSSTRASTTTGGSRGTSR
jgi:ketosteroid isomerase-like protein